MLTQLLQCIKQHIGGHAVLVKFCVPISVVMAQKVWPRNNVNYLTYSELNPNLTAKFIAKLHASDSVFKGMIVLESPYRYKLIVVKFS